MNRRSFFNKLIAGAAILAIPKAIQDTEDTTIKPPDVLFDGHTKQWIDFSMPFIHANGTITWVDKSGNNNHAYGHNHFYFPGKEVISRDIADTPESREKISNYLLRKHTT